ncbi:TPA: hypothetical protein N0F65_007188, partial [Lagenidium giganteum]
RWDQGQQCTPPFPVVTLRLHHQLVRGESQKSIDIMNTKSWIALVAVVAALTVDQTAGAKLNTATAASQKKLPYACEKDADCADFEDTVCIVVDNYGQKVGKCTPNTKERPACRGGQPGLCPSYQDASIGYLNVHCVFVSKDRSQAAENEDGSTSSSGSSASASGSGATKKPTKKPATKKTGSGSGAKAARQLKVTNTSSGGSADAAGSGSGSAIVGGVRAVNHGAYATVVVLNKTIEGVFKCVDVSDCANQAYDKSTCEPSSCGATSANKNQCDNQGTCTYTSIQTMNKRRCMCYRGFTGKTCEDETGTECDVDCGIGGVCKNGHCQCVKGYDGKLVKGKQGEPSPRCTRCTSDIACQNKNPCNIKTGVCDCEPGFFGPTCGATEDGCTSIKCGNHGRCQVAQNGTGVCFCDKCRGSKCQQCEDHKCMECPNAATSATVSKAVLFIAGVVAMALGNFLRGNLAHRAWCRRQNCSGAAWRAKQSSTSRERRPATMVNLTPNAVPMLYNNQMPDGFEPWLQIIDTRKIKPATGSGGDRYRIVLSDGTSYISGMLATQLAPMMESESLKVNYVVQLKDFLGNEVQGKKILIVLSIGEIVPAFERIGAPQSIEGGAKPAPSMAQPVGPAAPVATMPAPAAARPQQFNNAPMNTYQAPQPSYAPAPTKPAAAYNRGPVVREDPNVRLSDIHSLNPYAGGRWTIKARVTSRAPVKNWTNARGQGKLFSVDLLDAKGGEIRATMFNDAVDKFYELLRPGGVFYFSGGKIKMANRKFSSVDNDYEVSFDQHSDIVPAPEDGGIQQMNYNFKKIAAVESCAPDSNIDIIAVVKNVGPVNEIMSKAGKQLFKRDILLVDDSNAEIKCTLWNERAQEDCSSWANNVVAIKGCRVSDYNGRSIGTVSSSSFTVNPTIPEAGYLLNWFNTGGSMAQTKSLSASAGGFGGGGLGTFAERSVISDIKGKQLGFGQKPDYITVKGMINFIKHDTTFCYQACTKCQKKVMPDVAGNFTCVKCQTSYKTCENRYIMSVVLLDHTGNTWTTCFNDQGKVVMNGRTADEIAELKETNATLFEAAFKDAMFKEYVFRLRVKAENVQEELRVKAGVVNLEPINYVEESKDLLKAIAQYN